MQDLVIFGVPAAVIITGVIQALKKGWPKVFVQPRWAILAAVLTGVALGALAAAVTPCAALECWVKALLAGLLAGLASSGFYDSVRTIQALRKQ